jgi:transcriptional regulator with XRE-family HTH domain
VKTTEPQDPGIGTRLRAARERRGWSREALALHAGVSWSAIAQVESGRRRHVRPDTLSALAEALGVTIDYLVRGAPTAAPMLDHYALLYRTEQEFVDVAGPYLAEGIEGGEATLAVTTGANIELLRDHLGADAKKVEFIDSATAPMFIAPVAAQDAFKAFMDAKLEDGAPWIRIIGEPRWAGRSKAEVRHWTQFESFFNVVFSAAPMTALCPYDARSLAPAILKQAHHTHPRTIGPGPAESSPDYADPGGFILKS